jgi:hypothetical protein
MASASDPTERLLLIVTGSTLRAEELDRPLAYYLKQRIERATADDEADPPPPSARRPRFRVRVVADFRWLHEKSLQELPTISVGGPGVNALARDWLEELPVSLAVDEQYYIQMDPDLNASHASVWGMDNVTTQIAVSVFLERFLPRFLEHSAAGAPNHPDRDEID